MTDDDTPDITSPRIALAPQEPPQCDLVDALRAVSAERDQLQAALDEAAADCCRAVAERDAAKRALVDVRAETIRLNNATDADYARRVEALTAERDAARAEVERLREALTPSGETKAAYNGEFNETIPLIDDDGEEYPHTVLVSWTTIKEIMTAIRARAALGQEPGSQNGEEKQT